MFSAIHGRVCAYLEWRSIRHHQNVGVWMLMAHGGKHCPRIPRCGAFAMLSPFMPVAMEPHQWNSDTDVVARLARMMLHQSRRSGSPSQHSRAPVAGCEDVASAPAFQLVEHVAHLLMVATLEAMFPARRARPPPLLVQRTLRLRTLPCLHPSLPQNHC